MCMELFIKQSYFFIAKHICHCLNDKRTRIALLIHNYENINLVRVICDQFIICLNLYTNVVMIIYLDGYFKAAFYYDGNSTYGTK